MNYGSFQIKIKNISFKTEYNLIIAQTLFATIFFLNKNKDLGKDLEQIITGNILIYLQLI